MVWLKRWQGFGTIAAAIVVAATLTACHSERRPAPQPEQGSIQVSDGDGYPVVLTRPAQKIITLSPHTTELVYAIGAGNQIAATTSYSDYPEEAKTLPTVGDVHQLDVEAIIARKPDLIVLWPSGSASRQIDELVNSGIPVYRTHPKKLSDIPDDMEKLGILTGHADEGRAKAAQWRSDLENLTNRYSNGQKIRVFYQVFDRPLYTIGGNQFIGEAINRCGGENIFQDIKALAPIVSVEDVLARKPDAIISTGGMSGENGLGLWKRFPIMSAVKANALYYLDSDIISRPGPRLVDGMKTLCEDLADARAKHSQP